MSTDPFGVEPLEVSTEIMPAAFFGHGNPMNALEVNRYTAAWQAFGCAVPRPRAILVVSAHWYINATAVTAMPRPRTIHDFYGFPAPLFDVQYPRTGPAGAGRRGQRRRPPDLGRRRRRQLGHRPRHLVGAGARVSGRLHPGRPAEHQRRQADGLPPQARREAGTAPGARRAHRASGNVVHNLRGMDWKLADDGYDWAQRFDEDAKARMLDRPDRVRHPRRPPRLRPRRADPGPLHPRRSTWPAWPARPRPRTPKCSSTATPTARCR